MKRFLFIVGMVLLTCTSMMAQSSMTDEQVIKFVMKEQKAGTSQQEIAVKLVQKGVTTDQIKRVQTKVERLKKNQGLGTVEDKTLGEDGRQRKNNGNPRKQKDDNQSTQKLKDKNPRRIAALEEAEGDLEDEKASMLKKDLDIFMPDFAVKQTMSTLSPRLYSCCATVEGMTTFCAVLPLILIVPDEKFTPTTWKNTEPTWMKDPQGSPPSGKSSL